MYIAPYNADTKRPHESEAGSVGLAPMNVNKQSPLLDSLCVHVLFIIARHRHQNMVSEWDFFSTFGEVISPHLG